ncbi:nitroreductase family deazaflavin-dependent oxidoreductase [Actinomadura vinacea]|uniref:Nitroreductase family deazaflavin-dependent oxidoreductase n=1 Tax=Actinomadura vinacea TaxID=115336 RepID=A0ABN3INY5_9ACTN
MSEPDFPGQHDYSLLGENHVRAYRESGGEVGYMWNGAPTLLLTTVGRRSGRPRTIAIIYGRDGNDHLLIASRGGAPKHPHWYLNLQANPEAEIQVKSEIIQVTAHTAAEAEKPRLWKIMTGIWPNYDVYQERTDRIIPVVVLRPR